MNSDEMRKDILALMRLRNAMEDGPVKDMCRAEIRLRTHEYLALVKMDKIHTEALVWNEACWWFLEK